MGRSKLSWLPDEDKQLFHAMLTGEYDRWPWWKRFWLWLKS